MAKKSFFKGAVILGIAGIIVKVFGAFFRIPLANIIGDTGMGYYQTWEYNDQGDLFRYSQFSNDGTIEWYRIYEYDM